MALIGALIAWFTGCRFALAFGKWVAIALAVSLFALSLRCSGKRRVASCAFRKFCVISDRSQYLGMPEVYFLEECRDARVAKVVWDRTVAKMTAGVRFARDFPLAIVLVAWVCGSYPTGAGAGETCSEGWGPGQYFDDLSVCVSSVLGAQGRFDYQPGNLLDGSENAWCEGVSGDGSGETITFRIPNAAFPKLFRIRSGYAKSRSAFRNNASPLRLLMRDDAGDSQLVTLADTRKEQIIPVPWSAGTVNWISFEILSVRAGRKYHDTCITSFSPDFEGY